MRTPIIAGNWKMNGTLPECIALAEAVAEGARRLAGVTIIVAPPLTALAAVSRACAQGSVAVAAQNMHWADKGAFTGEVSPPMVREQAQWVIVGHSERRSLAFETDDEVNRKVHSAYRHGLGPILCVGETSAERAAGATDAVVTRQVLAGLDGVAPREADTVVIAYEPVWAIGTGVACSAEEAGRVLALIRTTVAAEHGSDAAERVRLLYGGSATPANIEGYLADSQVDGALVGGAALVAESFLDMAAAAAGSGSHD